MRIQVRGRVRRGMSLVEVMVALGLLGGVMMSMAMFALKLAMSTTVARYRATAGQLVSDRLESVKSAPSYGSIDTIFTRTEYPIPGFAGFTRQTWVSHVGGSPTDTIDYRLITVEVRHAKLKSPVRKTSAIPPF